MTHLFLSEPPLRFGQDEPPADLADRLQSLVEEGRSEEAVLLFLRENVRLPEEAIGQLRASEMFAELAGLAQTTIYDHRLVAAVSASTPEMLAIKVPTTVLHGVPAVPFIVAAAERLAGTIPGAELVVVPESHDHGVDPGGTTREVLARLR
jgi:pimeloyl-ACP methyl ester carboxylesterase